MKNLTLHDMISGPLTKGLFLYSIPLVFSGLLQHLFNAADMAVGGRFTGSDALTAVSAAGPVTSMIVAFYGIEHWRKRPVAQYIGSGETEELQRGVHTSMTFSLAAEIVLMMISEIIARPLLFILKTPDQVLPLSLIYLRLYFIGVPAMLFYNF